LSSAASALPPELADEFVRNEFNPCVGQVLLSANERSRVWFIRLQPGERIGFHRHVLDYFWTALSAGSARSHVDGGPPRESQYFAGQTSHLQFAPGEFMLHDLENTGSTPLLFITVEHLQSANAPLPLPQSVTPRGLDEGLKLS
jgi:mannose-6-phosphate isomerase-like protein (cupin superfamily)